MSVTAGRMSIVVQHARDSARRSDVTSSTDGDLLAAFRERREEAAFEVLVRRHGPMVMGVCRRVLPNSHDAEDAFQATFLVLAKKAASIASPELLANWLHGVAHNTARRARTMIMRRRARETQVAEMPEPEAAEQDLWNDLPLVLDEELSRLPEKYRVPIVLCDLEGRTRREVAEQLGCPDGTVAARLARGRVMLARRLGRRGVALSAGVLAAVLSRAATACVPPALRLSTTRAATLFAKGEAATGVVSAQVAVLTEGVVKAMVISKLKVLAVGVALLAVCTMMVPAGATAWAKQSAQADRPSHSLDPVAKAPLTHNPNTTKSGEPDPRAVPAPGPAEPEAPAPEAPEAPDAMKAVKGLIDEYTKDQQGILERLVKVETEDGREALRRELLILGHTYAPRLLALAEKDPTSGAGLWALMFLVGNADTAPEADKAVTLFVKHHLGTNGLLAVAPASCEGFGRSCSPAVETLLRAVLEQPKSNGEAGQACFALGKLLRVRAQVARELKGQQNGYLSDPAREAVVRVQAPRATALAQQLSTSDPEKLETEAERYFERVVRDYGDGKSSLGAGKRTLGELAKAELFELRELTPGKNAPEIEGKDLEGKALKLSDHRGKVVVLTFWGSWCPACMKMVPSEKELAKRLADKPFALVGVNSDADRLVAKEAARDKEMSWRSFWDESAGKTTPDGPIATRWNLGSWPTTYVIDHRGVIRARFTGPPDPKLLDRQIDDLVREVGKVEKP